MGSDSCVQTLPWSPRTVGSDSCVKEIVCILERVSFQLLNNSVSSSVQKEREQYRPHKDAVKVRCWMWAGPRTVPVTQSKKEGFILSSIFSFYLYVYLFVCLFISASHQSTSTVLPCTLQKPREISWAPPDLTFLPTLPRLLPKSEYSFHNRHWLAGFHLGHRVGSAAFSCCLNTASWTSLSPQTSHQGLNCLAGTHGWILTAREETSLSNK